MENDDARGFDYEDDVPPPPEPPRPPLELFEAETDLKAAPKRRLAAPKAEEDDDWGNDDLGALKATLFPRRFMAFSHVFTCFHTEIVAKSTFKPFLRRQETFCLQCEACVKCTALEKPLMHGSVVPSMPISMLLASEFVFFGSIRPLRATKHDIDVANEAFRAPCRARLTMRPESKRMLTP